MADSVRKTCPGCKRRFRPAARNRRYCETCRPSRVAAGSVDPLSAPSVDDDLLVEPIVRAELERTERLDTIEGVLLLRLARDVDRLPADKRAAAAGKMLRVKVTALAGTRGREVNPLDELDRKRRERLASA